VGAAMLWTWLGWTVRGSLIGSALIGGLVFASMRLPGSLVALNELVDETGRLRAIFILDAARPGMGVWEWTRHVPQPTYYHQANLTRDGQQLVYLARIGGVGVLHTLELSSPTTDGRRAVPLQADDLDSVKLSPVWSPDGRQIAFSAARAGGIDLYILDARTGQERQVTFSPQQENHPAWSPDGRWLAYAGWQPESIEIMIVSADGGAPRRLTHNASLESRPVWSPDGRYIAYESNAAVPSSADIYIVEVETGEQRRLTPALWRASQPVWTADGGRIAFLAVIDGSTHLGVVDLWGGVALIKTTRTDALWALDLPVR
jgi:TolB protein